MHRGLTAQQPTYLPGARTITKQRGFSPNPRPSAFGLLMAAVGLLVVAFGALAGAAVLEGQAQPESAWVQVLHLEDCAFPCWLGITVGETGMEEARMTVRQVFGTSPAYELREESYQAFWTRYFVTRYEDGQGFMLYLNSIDGGDTVRQLEVWPIDPGGKLPALAELVGVLGMPSGVGFELVMGQPVMRVAFQANRLRVSTEYLACGKVDFMQTVESIRLDDAAYAGGLSAEPWRGFRQCYFPELYGA